MSFSTIAYGINDHLNIEDGTDFDLLEQKVAVAEAWISKFIGTPLDDEETFPDGPPEPLKEAVRQLVGHLYENREATLIGVTADEIPFGVMDLITPFRTWVF
ncbi:head-tail connector protein [Pelagibacterium mangrovi]|uniref:head-tail connector protein n=1 Tax=Pelagibacterium mangrovi TaxID=3119828 RepID=UPI002FC64C47